MALIVARVGEPIARFRFGTADSFVGNLARNGLSEEEQQKQRAERFSEAATYREASDAGREAQLARRREMPQPGRCASKSPPQMRRGWRGHRHRRRWLIYRFDAFAICSNHPGSSPRPLPSPPCPKRGAFYDAFRLCPIRLMDGTGVPKISERAYA
jgi:hypothetical protein